jgi:mono/diheme cytochrome c family protein
MAQPRSFSFASAIAGALALLLILIIAAAAVIYAGLVPVAASSEDGATVRSLLVEAREHSIERSAAGLAAPRFTAEDVREGGSHFKGMCQACHGGPGAEPAEFAAGMNPRPPNLAKAAGDLSVAQVFWTAKNGIRMTGMPGFGHSDQDDELWKVAAFVKHLPKVTAAEYAALPNAHEHEEAEQAGQPTHHHHH